MSNYALEGPAWHNPSNLITWSYATAGGVFSNAIGDAYKPLVTEALQRWEAAANITFVQVGASVTADIEIGFGLFSGLELGDAGYYYSTDDDTGKETFLTGVTVRVEDPAQDFAAAIDTALYSGTATTMEQILLHEIGHALGLDHSTQASAVMYPAAGVANRTLSQYDIAGVQALYGPPTIQAATGRDTGTSVFRFFDTLHGTQFLTNSISERNAVIATRPDLSYEGKGLSSVDPSSANPNVAPVFRFFDMANGTHFLTISTTERDALIASRPTLQQEATTFYEHRTAQTGDTGVYRYFDSSNGSHFYTASSSERASIAASRPDLIAEGVAFYMPAA